jgi:hypothetical protein
MVRLQSESNKFLQNFIFVNGTQYPSMIITLADYNSNAAGRKKGNQPASKQAAEENTNLTYHLQ